jgi:hypothetical protein
LPVIDLNSPSQCSVCGLRWRSSLMSMVMAMPGEPKPPVGPCPEIPQVGSVWHFDSQMNPNGRYHHENETHEVVGQQKDDSGIRIEMRSVQITSLPTLLVPIQCWSEDGWPFRRYDKLWMIP